MNLSPIVKWASILVVIVTGLTSRFLFAWEPKSKRNQVIYFILLGVVILFFILMELDYVRM
jgi:hypothetical protein